MAELVTALPETSVALTKLNGSNLVSASPILLELIALMVDASIVTVCVRLTAFPALL